MCFGRKSKNTTTTTAAAAANLKTLAGAAFSTS